MLLSKPAALLAATELKKWRDSLLGAMAPSTINRLCRCLCAALELAAQHDERITGIRQAREIGLAGLPDAQEARNVIISDEKVREFVATAYGLDGKFGLLQIHWRSLAHGQSGGQATCRGFARDHPVRPKLMMPKSAKGWRQKPQPEKDRTLFGAGHRPVGGLAEGGGERPWRG